MIRKQIACAHELKDVGTVQVLEEVLVDREDPGYHLYSVLEDDTLVRGMNHLLDHRDDRAGDRPMPPDSMLQ
jgi:starvation-inducible DNA-binding protein